MDVASVQAEIEQTGELVELRRYDGTSEDHESVTCRAMVREQAPVMSGSGQPIRVWRVILGNAEIAAVAWPGPPVEGDEIVRDGVLLGRVHACDSRKIGDEIAAHWITARG